MLKNEGQLDRIARGVLGVALIGLALFSSFAPFATAVGFWLAIVVGLVLAVTAVTGFCPAYRLLGLRSCRDC